MSGHRHGHGEEVSRRLSEGRRGSKVNFVFELPPDRFARCSRAHTEQNAAVPFEGAGPDIRNNAEQLRADAVVLRPVRIESLEGARLAIGLKARLDRRAEGEPRFPSV